MNLIIDSRKYFTWKKIWDKFERRRLKKIAQRLRSKDIGVIIRTVAEGKSDGSILASDAFFPFSDNVQLAHKIGVKSLIQPGGSIRDNEVIDLANKLNISMIFTGTRHFKH